MVPELGWFAANRVKLINPPPYSPDLNPIEHLWSFVKSRLKGKKFDSKAALWVHIQRLWATIRPSLLKNLVDSMPNRLNEVMKAKGGPTNMLYLLTPDSMVVHSTMILNGMILKRTLPKNSSCSTNLHENVTRELATKDVIKTDDFSIFFKLIASVYLNNPRRQRIFEDTAIQLLNISCNQDHVRRNT
ncbi:unnamed protein product, partial [Mesorhabditis belari]|uniref:Tc1-like transposase DDE domain-containing protein n=1 Tax=Mesorhabditis belari TaxID=2138241 RepID=A0AAF3ENW6_9BILA